MRILSIAILFSCLFITDVWAQEFTFSGQIRPRTEYRHGFGTLIAKDVDPALFTQQRSRINLLYDHPDYTFKLVFQDIRTWGNTSQLKATDGLTSVHEAWAKVKLSNKVGIKLGRQEIIYDDHRIFGSVDWAQQARSHDAALLTVADSSWKFHVGLAYNQNGPSLTNTAFTIANQYKTFQYLWFHKDWNGAGLSLLFLNNGQQVVTVDNQFVNFNQTMGTRLSVKQGKLSAAANFYYQTGEQGNAASTKISAWNFRADLSYKLSDKLIGKLGAELLSGNDQNGTDPKNKAFNPLFGTNHKFNGLMDYFYVGNHAGSVGLHDFFAGIKVPNKKGAINADIHLFNSAGVLVNPSDGSDAKKYMGAELDIYGAVKIKPTVKLSFGYSHLFAGSSMEILKGGDNSATNNWAWLMIDFKPVFFKTKK